jgi:hypothetical protein
MGAVIENTDSIEPLERVGIRMADLVPANPLNEVVSIHADPSRPCVHVMIRRVVPGTTITLTPRRLMDGNGCMAHLELIG